VRGSVFEWRRDEAEDWKFMNEDFEDDRVTQDVNQLV
jgi:hypothetical protein